MWCVARDSAVLGGLVRSKGIIVLLQWLWEWQYSVQREAIPPVVARIFFGRQDLTFDKGGKCDSVFRGIVRFGKGWCGRKAWCAFKRVVGVTVFGATGGASSLPYEKRW